MNPNVFCLRKKNKIASLFKIQNQTLNTECRKGTRICSVQRAQTFPTLDPRKIPKSVPPPGEACGSGARAGWPGNRREVASFDPRLLLLLAECRGCPLSKTPHPVSVLPTSWLSPREADTPRSGCVNVCTNRWTLGPYCKALQSVPLVRKKGYIDAVHLPSPESDKEMSSGGTWG